jgi:hypothetical protein
MELLILPKLASPALTVVRAAIGFKTRKRAERERLEQKAREEEQNKLLAEKQAELDHAARGEQLRRDYHNFKEHLRTNEDEHDLPRLWADARAVAAAYGQWLADPEATAEMLLAVDLAYYGNRNSPLPADAGAIISEHGDTGARRVFDAICRALPARWDNRQTDFEQLSGVLDLALHIDRSGKPASRKLAVVSTRAARKGCYFSMPRLFEYPARRQHALPTYFQAVSEFASEEAWPDITQDLCRATLDSLAGNPPEQLKQDLARHLLGLLRDERMRCDGTKGEAHRKIDGLALLVRALATAVLARPEHTPMTRTILRELPRLLESFPSEYFGFSFLEESTDALAEGAVALLDALGPAEDTSKLAQALEHAIPNFQDNAKLETTRNLQRSGFFTRRFGTIPPPERFTPGELGPAWDTTVHEEPTGWKMNPRKSLIEPDDAPDDDSSNQESPYPEYRGFLTSGWSPQVAPPVLGAMDCSWS